MQFDKEYYLNFGHHNDNIGTVARHVDFIRTKQRVLIVPCGFGQIMNWCLSEGIDCTGYDINIFLIQMAQKHLYGKIFLNDIRTMGRVNKPFDLVICTDVLEHFTEDGIDAALKQIVMNLLPGAHVLMRVGTDELDVFDEDPTHQTKKSMSWWMEKFAAHGLYIHYGLTAMGEVVLSKTNPATNVAEQLSSKRTICQPREKLAWGDILSFGDIVISDHKENKYIITDSEIIKNHQRYFPFESADRILVAFNKLYMLKGDKIVGAVDTASRSNPLSINYNNQKIERVVYDKSSNSIL